MKYLSSSVQLEDTSEWERRKFFGFIGIHKCFVSRTPKNAATLFSYLYVKFCQCRRFKSLFKRLKASEIGNQQYEKWSKVFKTCSSLSFSASLSVIPAFSLESISWTFFFFFPLLLLAVLFSAKKDFQETFLCNILRSSYWWKLLKYTNALSFVFDGYLKHSLLLYSFTVMSPCSAPSNQYHEPISLWIMTTLYSAVTIILS